MNISEENIIKKRKKGIETRKRILEISAGLFARSGYESVSLRQIADILGIKESSIYNHFKSKDEIRDSLFMYFRDAARRSRPPQDELDEMLKIMQPAEIFKHIVFHVGNRIDPMLQDTAVFINYEKFRNPEAAEVYRKYMVEEPVAYYRRLIEKMAALDMIRPVESQVMAEQYNYVSLALTQEYFVLKNCGGDHDEVVRAMIRTLDFFCGLMKKQG